MIFKLTLYFFICVAVVTARPQSQSEDDADDQQASDRSADQETPVQKTPVQRIRPANSQASVGGFVLPEQFALAPRIPKRPVPSRAYQNNYYDPGYYGQSGLSFTNRDAGPPLRARDGQLYEPRRIKLTRTNTEHEIKNQQKVILEQEDGVSRSYYRREDVF